MAIRISGVGKRFGGTQALADVDLVIAAGTVHALVGENGAGKSTLLGVLAGRVPPGTGQLEVYGRRVAPGDPRAARDAGVAAIHQEPTMLPAMSALANVFLGRYPSRHGLLDEAGMRARYDRLCARLDVRIPHDARAFRLSPAQQQLLEIMRALDADARIVLLDEPTACLGAPEREALFDLMAHLRESGVTMVFVSHELDEVLRIADRVTVLRGGRIADTRAVSEWTKPALVRAMIAGSGTGSPVGPSTGSRVGPSTASRVGPSTGSRPRPSGGYPPGGCPGPPPGEAELLGVEGLDVPGVLCGVTFAVRPGEIVGVGGLGGSGRTTLLRCLMGLVRPCSGRLRIDGVSVDWPRSVRQALRLGLALVPEDRAAAGLVPALSAQENVAVADLHGVSHGFLVSRRMMRRRAAEATAVLDFDPARLDDPVRTLSGGNQQKLLLSRWRYRRPRVLLADEPCRGIDTRTRAQILRALRRESERGMGILMVSSQLEELAEVCDRVVVLARGRVTAILDATRQALTAGEILSAAHGLDARHG